MKSIACANRQSEMFLHSKTPTIDIEATHRLVLMADGIDWTTLLELAEKTRLSRVKTGAGRKPKLRPLVGALVLRATSNMTLRQVEDMIRHHGPSRYLCGLTESKWSPDFRTLHDFEVTMGEAGVKAINEFVVKQAVAENLADPSVVVADTTAQEATIPWPNEMRMMSKFMMTVMAASQKAGTKLRSFVKKMKTEFQEATKKVRDYRLFAKTKEAKTAAMKSMMRIISRVQKNLAVSLEEARKTVSEKYAKVALRKVESVHETMKTLLPQIAYWLRTGFVAKKKVISIHMNDVYSIVRGKIGKTVEFGLNWGITRLRGGFLLARVAVNSTELLDHKFVPKAVEDCVALFGKPPQKYAYDRGGFSEPNVKALKKLGVKEVGLAPRGKTKWSVCAKVKKELVRERALVEGGIGTIKCNRYGFTKPRAKSSRMMGTRGQCAVLGFNLNKLVRERAKRDGVVVAAN